MRKSRHTIKVKIGKNAKIKKKKKKKMIERAEWWIILVTTNVKHNRLNINATSVF